MQAGTADPDRQEGTGQPTRHCRNRQAEEGGSGDRRSSSKQQQHQEGLREAGEVPGTERGTGEDVEGEGQSGSSGDRSTRSCNPQAGRVAPTDLRNNIRPLCPEERDASNS